MVASAHVTPEAAGSQSAALRAAMVVAVVIDRASCANACPRSRCYTPVSPIDCCRCMAHHRVSGRTMWSQITGNIQVGIRARGFRPEPAQILAELDQPRRIRARGTPRVMRENRGDDDVGHPHTSRVRPDVISCERPRVDWSMQKN